VDGGLDVQFDPAITAVVRDGDLNDNCDMSVRLEFDVVIDIPDFGTSSTTVVPVQIKTADAFDHVRPVATIGVYNSPPTSKVLEGLRPTFLGSFGRLEARQDLASSNTFDTSLDLAIPGDQLTMKMVVVFSALDIASTPYGPTRGVLAGRFELRAIRPGADRDHRRGRHLHDFR
jgi:hypothetical protein